MRKFTILALLFPDFVRFDSAGRLANSAPPGEPADGEFRALKL